MSTDTLEAVLQRARNWPKEDQEELAELALEIEARQTGDYVADDEELRALDEAVEVVRRGEIATDQEAEAVFAKHRRK